MKFFTKLCLILLSAILFFSNAYADNFVAISDIHFNPLYECERVKAPCPAAIKLKNADYYQWEKILAHYGKHQVVAYGNDSNYALLKSMLRAIKTNGKAYAPQFALLLGDFLGHNFRDKYQSATGDHTQAGYESFVAKTTQFLILELQNALPNVPLYPVMGNNDSYTDDYSVMQNGPFFADMQKFWSAAIYGKQQSTEFKTSFSVAGYYAVTLPPDNQHRLIVLNSILFSKKVQGDNTDQAARQELKWFKTQLAMAQQNKQKVWLAFHIPTEVRTNKAVESFIFMLNPFWSSYYINSFFNILNQYPSVVQTVFASHIHMDGFLLLNQVNGQALFENFVPSISPIFGNNPAFKIYTYDEKTFQLQNFVVYYLLENKLQKGYSEYHPWQLEYDFNATYQPTCKVCLLDDGMKKILDDPSLQLIYNRYYTVGNPCAELIETGKFYDYYHCAASKLINDH